MLDSVIRSCLSFKNILNLQLREITEIFRSPQCQSELTQELESTGLGLHTHFVLVFIVISTVQ